MSVEGRSSSSLRHRQTGLTLIELVMFIVVVGIGLAGIVSVFTTVAGRSADPMIQKQMLSIAEALLEEVELQPFTNCDQTDANWMTANCAATADPGAICPAVPKVFCATTVQGLGATAGQERVNATTPFNNVGDYSGLALASLITDISGNSTAPAGFSATVAIVPEALGGINSAACADGNNCAAMNVVRIAVTVCRAALPCPAGADTLTLEGYRARYWPNDQPW